MLTLITIFRHLISYYANHRMPKNNVKKRFYDLFLDIVSNIKCEVTVWSTQDSFFWFMPCLLIQKCRVSPLVQSVYVSGVLSFRLHLYIVWLLQPWGFLQKFYDFKPAVLVSLRAFPVQKNDLGIGSWEIHFQYESYWPKIRKKSIAEYW